MRDTKYQKGLSKLGYTDFHMIKILTMNRASNTGQSDI